MAFPANSTCWKIDRLAKSIDCDYCGAEPGESCMTHSNKPCPFHVDRWEDAKKLIDSGKVIPFVVEQSNG